MRCGHCHQDHETVAQVRDCYGVGAVATQVRVNKYHGDCHRCGAFIEKERGHIELVDGNWRVFHNGACPEQVKIPVKPVAPTQVKVASERWTDIPAGHYAVPSLTGNNDLDFFRVDRPEEGKWAGYVFVKRVIGGRPSVPVRKAEKARALAAIAQAGIEAAAVKYGQEIGRCYRCNRHLTDETSRRLGIGPDCRSRAS